MAIFNSYVSVPEGKTLPHGLCCSATGSKATWQRRWGPRRWDEAHGVTCNGEYHFAVVAYACDLYVIKLGMGLAVNREYGGHAKDQTKP
jgi:hypothetical protein